VPYWASSSSLNITKKTFGGNHERILTGWAYARVKVGTALLARTVFGGNDYAKIFSNIILP
jgi:hypothetical protein